MKLETINVEGPATGGAFDSHAHFGDDWRAVLLRAREAGMAGLVAVGCDARTNAFALAVAQAAPDFALLALGFDYSSGVTPEEAIANLVAPSPTCAAAPLWGCAPAPPPSERGVPRRGGGSTSCGASESVGHPCETIALEEGSAASVSSRLCVSVLNPPRLAAIGEIGLDYSHPGADPVAQRALFERQVALAAEWGLPVIVHSREAAADTLAILRAAGSRALAAEGRLGVLHCFVGDAAFAEEVLSLGMMVSLSGIVTFRNADALRAVAATIPGDRLLVETDSPYLAPVPLRGRVNEPAFIEHTVRCLAALRNTSWEELSSQTTSNALRLFRPWQVNPQEQGTSNCVV